MSTTTAPSSAQLVSEDCPGGSTLFNRACTTSLPSARMSAVHLSDRMQTMDTNRAPTAKRSCWVSNQLLSVVVVSPCLSVSLSRLVCSHSLSEFHASSFDHPRLLLGLFFSLSSPPFCLFIPCFPCVFVCRTVQCVYCLSSEPYNVYCLQNHTVLIVFGTIQCVYCLQDHAVCLMSSGPRSVFIVFRTIQCVYCLRDHTVCSVFIVFKTIQCVHVFRTTKYV